MALPWLIGAAVIAAGTALVKKLNEDDSSSSYDDEREARRREEAERERAKNERKKKIETARENFVIRGESIGSDIVQSLQGWIEVKLEQSPAFSAQLNKDIFDTVSGQLNKSALVALAQRISKGEQIESAPSNEQSISALLPSSGPQFEKIKENLKTYSDIYSVKLKQGVKLVDAGTEIEMIESELRQLDKLKAEMSKLQSHLCAQL